MIAIAPLKICISITFKSNILNMPLIYCRYVIHVRISDALELFTNISAFEFKKKFS